MKKITLIALLAVATLFATAIATPDSKASPISEKAKIELNFSLDNQVAIVADGVVVMENTVKLDTISNDLSVIAVKSAFVSEDDIDDDPGKKLFDAEFTDNSIKLKNTAKQSAHNSRYLERSYERQRLTANPVTGRRC